MQHQIRFATGLAAFALAAACADSPVAPTLAPDASFAKRASGTTLSAYKTAEGFREDRVEYDWTIDKKVLAILAGEHMLPEPRTDQTTILPGNDPIENVRWVDYQIAVTKTIGAEYSVAGVRGDVCVTNGGSVPTQGLAIVDVVQVKTGSGQFQDYASKPVDVSSKPVLAAGETKCYPYEVTFTPVKDADYRNTARVTITNHSGHLGEPFGPGAGGDGVKADFELPDGSTSVVKDDSAVLDEQLIQACRNIFPSIICTWGGDRSPVLPFTVTESTVFEIVVDIHNFYICGEELVFRNVATLTENGPRAPGEAPQVRSDEATLTVKTGDCPPKPANPGCTRTVGYWKNHAWPVHPAFPPSTLETWEEDNGWDEWLFFDSGKEWKEMLSVQPKGDAYVSLAHQYIAAILNQQSGAYVPAEVRRVLVNSYNYFSMSPAGRATVSRDQLLAWKDVLDRYNNGRLGVKHCG